MRDSVMKTRVSGRVPQVREEAVGTQGPFPLRCPGGPDPAPGRAGVPGRPPRRNGRGAAALLPGLVLSALLQGCGPSPIEPLVLRGGTLIDVRSGVERPGTTVVIEGGWITCVGETDACPAPAGAHTIDAQGTWILPGLIDAHAHLHAAGDQGLREQRVRFALGVTTARDAGTARSFERNLELKRSGADPRQPIPRLVVAARVFPGDLAEREAGEVVAGLADRGADAIKVKDLFPPADLIALSRATHDAGLYLYGHAFDGPPPRTDIALALSEARFDGLSHEQGFPVYAIPDIEPLSEAAPPEGTRAWRMWRRTLWIHARSDSLASVRHRMVRLGIWLEPTLASLETMVLAYRPPVPWAAALPGAAAAIAEMTPADLSGEDRERLLAALEDARTFVRGFGEEGGIVVAGSDGHPIELFAELRALENAGLAPTAVLRAATLDAAVSLRRDADIGSIEVGKRADLLVVEADPLADLEALWRARAIVKGGVVYEPAALRAAIEPGR